jgi:hypothetical protein
MKLRWKKIAAGTAALLLAVQFVPVDRSNPPVRFEVAAPADVARILERSCYDCHSNRTRWPWYSRVAPASWWVAHHVAEGRADLNFTEWPAFDEDVRMLALKDIEAEVAGGRMPLRSYLLGHPGARLSDRDSELLLAWARDR